MSEKTKLRAQLRATVDPMTNLATVISNAKASHITFLVEEEVENYSVNILFRATDVDDKPIDEEHICHVDLLVPQSISAAADQIWKYHLDNFNAIGGEYAVAGLYEMLRYATGLSTSEPDEWNEQMAHLVLSDYHSDDDMTLICRLLRTLNVQYGNYITFNDVVSKYGKFTILFTLPNEQKGKLTFSLFNAKQIYNVLLDLYSLTNKIEQMELEDSTFKKNFRVLMSAIE